MQLGSEPQMLLWHSLRVAAVHMMIFERRPGAR